MVPVPEVTVGVYAEYAPRDGVRIGVAVDNVGLVWRRSRKGVVVGTGIEVAVLDFARRKVSQEPAPNPVVVSGKAMTAGASTRLWPPNKSFSRLKPNSGHTAEAPRRRSSVHSHEYFEGGQI